MDVEVHPLTSFTFNLKAHRKTRYMRFYLCFH